MKKLFILTILIQSFSIFAQGPKPFQPLTDLHKALVLNQDEYFLSLKTFEKENTELGSIIAEHIKSIYGLNTLETNLYIAKNAKEKIMNNLFQGDSNFFCYTFIIDFTEDYDLEQCKTLTGVLIDALLKDSQDVAIVNIGGDYWGDFGNVLIIGLNYDKKSSASLSFDMLHEI